MNCLPFFPTIAAAAFFVAPPVVAQDETNDGEITEGQQELAELLEGRVAGEPQRCIRTLPNRSLNIIDDTAITYESGDTIYVNYTRNPDQLDDDDTLVIRKFGTSATQLCRLDNVTAVDRYSGIFSGAIFLTDFVPYEKPEAAE